jgi:hypothetical protein
MGDRVLFQVVQKVEGQRTKVGPVVYGHWCGSRAPKICAKLRDRMASRPGDLGYTAARLVQECTATDPDGPLSFGLWNATKPLKPADSHGDAGIVLVHLTNVGMIFECFGGYLETDVETGLPRERRETVKG